MNGKTGMIRRLVTVVAFALVLIGLSTQFASAELVKTHLSNLTKSNFDSSCGATGGTLGSEAGGNVHTCTFTDGGQNRCNFRTKDCTVSVRMSDDGTIHPPTSAGTISGNAKSGSGAVQSNPNSSIPPGTQPPPSGNDPEPRKTLRGSRAESTWTQPSRCHRPRETEPVSLARFPHRTRRSTPVVGEGPVPSSRCRRAASLRFVRAAHLSAWPHPQ